MAEVVLYVYDMTKNGNGHDAHNFSIVQMNKLLKDGISFGGIFHTAVQIYGNDEWAYGCRSKGTGVFTCPAGKNPSYTLREKIILGRTECSPSKVNKMLKELSDSWPGNKYNIVSRNSNHFSNELLERLGVPKLPGWVNRATNIADAAKDAAGTALKMKDEAMKRVLNPLDFAFGSKKKWSSKKSVKSTPCEFNININYFIDNFKVTAPEIRNEEDNIGPVHQMNHLAIRAIDEGPNNNVIRAIEGPDNDANRAIEWPKNNNVIPIVEEPDDDDDQYVIHKDAGPSTVIHADNKPEPEPKPVPVSLHA